jgi:hypothetical protein
MDTEPKDVVFTVRFPQSLMDEVLLLAKQDDRSVSDLMRQAMRREVNLRLTTTNAEQSVMVSGRGGGKSAAAKQAIEDGAVDVKKMSKPKLGTIAAATMITHDPDAVSEPCKHPIGRRIGTGCGLCLKDPIR